MEKVKEVLTDLELEIGSIVPALSAPSDIFRIHIEWMSGDADHYETDYYQYPPSDDRFKTIIRALQLFSKKDNSYDYEELKELFFRNNFDEEQTKFLVSSFWQDDIYEDRIPAIPKDIRISYFDENGVEFDIPFKY